MPWRENELATCLVIVRYCTLLVRYLQEYIAVWHQEHERPPGSLRVPQESMDDLWSFEWVALDMGCWTEEFSATKFVFL